MVGWTNFLRFSPDGGMIAEGGNEPPRETDSLILWSFPDGKLVRRFRYRPFALSADWKYLATEDAIVDMTTEKVVFRLGESLGKIRPDGRYLIAPSTGGPIGPRQFATGGSIYVFEVHDR